MDKCEVCGMQWTPPPFACPKCHRNVVNTIPAGDEKPWIDLGENPSPLQAESAVSIQVQQVISPDPYALHGAIEQGNVSLARQLLSQGYSVHTTDYEGWTPLHVAVMERPDTIAALEIVKMLLWADAAVDARDAKGWTPLHIAAMEGQLEMLDLLLYHGAAINAPDNKGRTPLEAAVREKQGRAAYFLLNSGGSIRNEPHQSVGVLAIIGLGVGLAGYRSNMSREGGAVYLLVSALAGALVTGVLMLILYCSRLCWCKYAIRKIRMSYSGGNMVATNIHPIELSQPTDVPLSNNIEKTTPIYNKTLLMVGAILLVNIIAVFAFQLGKKSIKKHIVPPPMTATTAAAPAPAAPPVDDGWVEFSDARGRFAIEFPGTPETEKTVLKTAIGKIPIYLSMFDRGEEAFAIYYHDYPSRLIRRVSTQRILNAVKDEYVKDNHGKLTREERIKFHGYPARDVWARRKDGLHVRLRLILCKNRLYRIMVFGASATNGPDVERFIESFRLL